MTPTRVLRSERLTLRPLDVTDAAFVASLYGDARVTRALAQIQGPLSIEEAAEFCRPAKAIRGEHRLGAELQPGGELIAVGRVRMDADQSGVATIGISLLPAFWDQGFGAELCGLLVEFATLEGASEIRATNRDDNPGSKRILEKLNFHPVEVGVSEIDSKGDAHSVTRWSLHIAKRRSRR
jgi:RimJ/RimL family protein N-acetyltransferase